jgi:hypothetical protein
MSGMYKVVGPDGTVYEAYCHFDPDGAWTLVQSYSFANRSLDQFKKALSEDRPISENALTWSGYRLSKARMESIKNNSTFLQFTCDYEKYLDIQKSDYVQIPLGNIKSWQGASKKVQDVLKFNGLASYVTIGNGRGKIGEYDLSDCQIRLRQYTQEQLHVHTIYGCTFNVLSCTYNYYYNHFGYYYYSPSACVKKIHRCVQNANSTTQLWFGWG